MNILMVTRDANLASAMSSPLTSLSSLDDDDQAVSDIPMFSHDPEDLKVAQVNFASYSLKSCLLTTYGRCCAASQFLSHDSQRPL